MTHEHNLYKKYTLCIKIILHCVFGNLFSSDHQAFVIWGQKPEYFPNCETPCNTIDKMFLVPFPISIVQ